jgi:hypothetical protein
MSDIEWVAESDWSKVTVGQRVRLVNADGTVELNSITNQRNFSIASNSCTYSRQEGWSLFVEAPPAVVLPTEPGFYSVGRKAHPYERLLVLREQWFELSAAGQSTDGYYTPNRLAEIAVRENRLTRLEPVPETAKKVLASAMETSLATPDSYWAQILSDVALKFGVK